MRIRLAVPFAVVVLLACQRPMDYTALLDVSGDGSTGLEGVVTRGPVMPVCRVGVPCDAPFASGFQVLRGVVPVARFRSDSLGHYRILLRPGTYGIRPDSGAPIWPPVQTRQVTVGGPGVTCQDLSFDTGIR